jgi:hypothetical protein
MSLDINDYFKNILEEIISSNYSEFFIFKFGRDFDYVYSIANIFTFIKDTYENKNADIQEILNDLIKYKSRKDVVESTKNKDKDYEKNKNIFYSLDIKTIHEKIEKLTEVKRNHIKDILNEYIHLYTLVQTRKYKEFIDSCKSIEEKKYKDKNVLIDLKIILNLIDNHKNTLLHNYLEINENADIDIDEINLLKTETNVNILNNKKNAPLHIYLINNNLPKSNIIKLLKTEQIDLLVKNKNEMLSTYLLNNIDTDYNIITNLISYNNLDEVDEEKRTPLMLYLYYKTKVSPLIIEKLRTEKNIKMKDNNNITPLEYYEKYIVKDTTTHDKIINLLSPN